MTMRRRLWVVAGCVLAMAMYACPWVNSRIFFDKVYTGWQMGAPGTSMASGNDLLWRLWLCPIAVLAILVLVAITKNPSRADAGTQIVLAVVAFAPIPLIIPPEVHTWGHSFVSYGWGLYVFCGILVVLVIEAVQRLRTQPVPAST